MKIDPVGVRLLVTFGIASLVALGLAVLLARPGTGLRPDRAPRALDLDEPPAYSGDSTRPHSRL